MSIKYVCSKCGKLSDPARLEFRCECGGLFDLEKFKISFSKEDIILNEWSLFRYLKALPLDSSKSPWKEISMGEGLTPLIPLDKENPNVLLKVDYLMPTLSFKDRGAAVLITKAKELGVKKVIQDSSGNAGNSIAAYASRAKMDCDIYVRRGTSERKIKQISSHGATVHIIDGTREDTAKAALKAVENSGSFYASHVYNPFFYQGTKTYAYEIYEQLTSIEDFTLMIPVGNGTLLLGCYYGFKELLELGLINKMPKIIAIQAEGCSPIYRAFCDNKDFVDEVINEGTLAEGIAIANPMRGSQILESVKSSGGEIIIAPEEKINDARACLAQKGFYVEPTTAAAFAGYLDYCSKNNLEGNSKFIIPLTGAGLKKD